ncbi:hypothetical protein FGADI_13377 [Fusarium gaditjirri]|uniref:Heterokaryon incompatibility domain-containing protein n=1 Tax=Fusarium gaditjirri TaxID=282569 RepID=A0A8H4WMW4_9HYPO|nr:hypothetical protein FGADI_13377 [Fusarium gaditjirri]
MKFTYHHLTRNSTEIRLVRLLESSCQDSPLSLELCHASINDTNYAALSYVWGDVANTVEIVLNHLSFRIGRNFHTALKQLQQNNFHGWLWIDSVCIQQLDISEKSYQVGQMGTIFSKADCVFSWLCQSTRETDRAMDFVSRVGPRALKLGPLDLSERDDVSDYAAAKKEFHICLQNLLPHSDTETKWSELAQFALDILCEPGLQLDASHDQSLVAGIDDLLARDYWCRVWINQEVGLAKKVVIMCGTKALSLDTLDAAFKALKACNHGYAHLRSDTSGFGKHWDPWTFYCLLPLEPDYSMAVAQIFITVTKAFIDQEYQSCSGYNLVSLVPRYESDNPHNLPSWVPNWQKVGQGNMNGHRINTGWYFNATPYTMMQPRPLVGSGDTLRVLRQRGCRVDLITAVMTPPRENGEDGSDVSTGEIAKSWLSATMKFTRLGCEPSPGEDYVWRTLLATRWRGVIRALMKEGSTALVRELMRRRHVDADLLTSEQIEFVKRLRSPLDRSHDLETLPG